LEAAQFATLSENGLAGGLENLPIRDFEHRSHEANKIKGRIRGTSRKWLQNRLARPISKTPFLENATFGRSRAPTKPMPKIQAKGDPYQPKKVLVFHVEVVSQKIQAV
jgi:hypothetical protein